MGEEFKVSPNQIFLISKKEGWKEQRKTYVDAISAETRERLKADAVEHRLKTIMRVRAAQTKVTARILEGSTKENGATLDRLVRLEGFLLGGEKGGDRSLRDMTPQEIAGKIREAMREAGSMVPPPPAGGKEESPDANSPQR